jgi:hypothetical protein
MFFSMCFWVSFFVVFCDFLAPFWRLLATKMHPHFALVGQRPPRGHGWGHMAPKWGPKAPKWSPRGSQMEPQRPQMEPKGTKMEPKRHPQRPRGGQSCEHVGTWCAQAPQCPKHDANMVQKWYKHGPKGEDGTRTPLSNKKGGQEQRRTKKNHLEQRGTERNQEERRRTKENQEGPNRFRKHPEKNEEERRRTRKLNNNKTRCFPFSSWLGSGGVLGAVFLMFFGCFFGVVFEGVLVTFLMELGSLLAPFGPTFLMFFRGAKRRCSRIGLGRSVGSRSPPQVYVLLKDY